MSEMIKVSALWKQKTKAGEDFLNGKLGDAKLLIFKNKHKKSEKHPDYIVYLAPYEKKEENTGRLNESAANPPQSDEDIPF